MTNWSEQFEIIKDKISSEGVSPSLKGIAERLGVSRGKVQAWAGGQRPSADDLELIGRELGFSASWLLFGESPVFRVEGETQRQVGESISPTVATPVADTIREAEIVLRRAGASEQSIWTAVHSLAHDRMGHTPEPETEADNRKAGNNG